MSATNEPERDAGASDGVEIAPGLRVSASVLRVEYARSSGPGGQNVNTRATKATLRVRMADLGLSPGAERRLRAIASRWLTDAGELVVTSDVHRTQERNREECFRRLRVALLEARRPPTVRVKTRPSRGAIERRIESKKRRSDVKRRRQSPPEGP